MEEDSDNWPREQLAGQQGSEEEGNERGEAAAGENQESWTWSVPAEWDQQGPSRTEPAGSEAGRVAAGAPEGREETGSEEAAEQTRRDSGSSSREEGSGGPGGGETAAAGGGAMAGLEVGGRRERQRKADRAAKKGKARKSKAAKDPGTVAEAAREPADPQSGSLLGERGEGPRERPRKRATKPAAAGAEQVERARPREKPSGLKILNLVETRASETLRGARKISSGGYELKQQVPLPKVRFSICPRPACQSLWSETGCASPSVINELAKMGDPNVLEMVRQEGRSRRRGAGGGSGFRARTPSPRAQRPRGPWQPGARRPSQSGVPCARQGPQD